MIAWSILQSIDDEGACFFFFLFHSFLFSSFISFLFFFQYISNIVSITHTPHSIHSTECVESCCYRHLLTCAIPLHTHFILLLIPFQSTASSRKKKRKKKCFQLSAFTACLRLLISFFFHFFRIFFLYRRFARRMCVS